MIVIMIFVFGMTIFTNIPNSSNIMVLSIFKTCNNGGQIFANICQHSPLLIKMFNKTCCNGGRWSWPTPQAKTCWTDRSCELNPSCDTYKVIVNILMVMMVMLMTMMRLITMMTTMILMMMMILKFLTLMWTSWVVYFRRGQGPLLKQSSWSMLIIIIISARPLLDDNYHHQFWNQEGYVHCQGAAPAHIHYWNISSELFDNTFSQNFLGKIVVQTGPILPRLLNKRSAREALKVKPWGCQSFEL